MFDNGGILSLLPDNLDQHSFLPSPIELAVKDLLPRPKIQFTVRDRDNDLASHHLPLDMRVRIVLARIVVPILVDRFVRNEPLEKIVVVLQESPLIVIDINARADVHWVDEAKSFLDAALLQCRLHLGCDVDVCPPRLRLKREFFAIGLHG